MILKTASACKRVTVRQDRPLQQLLPRLGQPAIRPTWTKAA
jgi:hypothetical protein